MFFKYCYIKNTSVSILSKNIYKINFVDKIMGTTIIKMKIMPKSPDSNLEKIKEDIKKIFEKKEFYGNNFSEEPIAFGLSAIIASFGCPEDEEMESLQEEIEKIDDVNSTEIVDMRRAIG